MGSQLQVDAALNQEDQPVLDSTGGASALLLSTNHVAMRGEADGSATLRIEDGHVAISNPGDGNLILELGTERSWVFKQTGTGKTTALELTAADPNNNNKDFIITTAGRVRVVGGEIVISHPGEGNALLTLGTERSWVFKQTGTGKTTALELTAADPNNNNKNFIINTDGRVGIGTRTPRAKLDVNGSVSVSDDILLFGADCAEEFDIRDDSLVEPGTVMTIAGPRALHHSTQPYDPRVAGIVAGAGDARPGIILGRTQGQGQRVAIALNGTAYCMVDASDFPVAEGDLLTTSARAGHAMRATERGRSFGSVLGKALGSLSGGSGLVPVLVSLQ